jgi:hypothetical protein
VIYRGFGNLKNCFSPYPVKSKLCAANSTDFQQTLMNPQNSKPEG